MPMPANRVREAAPHREMTQEMEFFASEEEAQAWEDYFSKNHEAAVPDQYLQHL